ncbi:MULTISPECIES: hypothetical protein [unclassified Corallococcus]|uniref:hypothetical protein n=1 Tax=unclassified Corallococcus TaxID=2685029 RepID=UPI001A8FB64C|nr:MULTISPECIES: hypothetical protein [unclassified Corallococcus]MBN9680864.1 hypothetical protein [Corallococcus sp. NCSPR001]WAS87532.1 hypothetical protein O0N60_11275 [Corallococcus sp. NCRR]
MSFQDVVENSGHRTVRVILDEGFQPKLLSIDVPPQVRLEEVTRFLIEQDVQWEHADPTCADLHPNEKCAERQDQRARLQAQA